MGWLINWQVYDFWDHLSYICVIIFILKIDLLNLLFARWVEKIVFHAIMLTRQPWRKWDSKYWTFFIALYPYEKETKKENTRLSKRLYCRQVKRSSFRFLRKLDWKGGRRVWWRSALSISVSMVPPFPALRILPARDLAYLRWRENIEKR